MNEPKPLLESSSSPTTRALLRSGLADAPSSHVHARVAAALGLTASAATVTAPAAATATAAATAANATAAAAGLATPLSGTSALVLGKWLLAGLAGGALVSGAVGVVEHVHSNGPGHARSVAPARAPAAARADAARVVAPGQKVAPVVESAATPVASLGAVRRGAASAPPAVTRPPASIEAETSRALGVEALHIDASRQALASGDARRALAELDAYQRVKVVGVLDREAALLRIRALALAGDGARAATLAREYLDTRPRDAYQAELEGVLARYAAKVPTPGIDR